MYKDKPYLPDYYKHRIAVVGDGTYFTSLRNAMTECIKRYGFIAYSFKTITEALDYNPTCVIVISPTAYIVPPRKNNILWVMVQCEQLFDRNSNQVFLKKNLIHIKPYLKNYDLILETCYNNVDKLAEITHADVKFFSVQNYDIEKQDKLCLLNNSNAKEYDLIFVGDQSGVMNRRQELMSYLKERYHVYPKSDNLWGEERDLAISKSKIGLNIHFEESRYSDSFRWKFYIENACMVLSEPVDYPYPYKLKEDYDEFLLTNICEKIDYYLVNENERNRLVNHAFNTLHSNTLFDATKVFIDWLIMKSYCLQLEKDMHLYNKLMFNIRTSRKNRRRSLRK